MLNQMLAAFDNLMGHRTFDFPASIATMFINLREKPFLAD